MRCEFWFAVSVLGSWTEQEWTHSQHVRKWTYNCTMLKLPIEIVGYVACTDTSR